MPCLDTSVVIDLIRGPRNSRFRAASACTRDLALAGKILCVSRLSQAELFAGAYRTHRPEAEIDRVTTTLAPMKIMELTEEIAEEYGRITAQLRKLGRNIGDIDAFIAATCIAEGIPVLTANPKHFRKVGGLEVLTYL